MNALLIDNDPVAIATLETLLDENCPQVSICGKVNTLFDAMSFISGKNKLDIIFSEIDLPNENGFKLAVNRPITNCEFIFVTENPKYALKAIKNKAVGFLLKPVKKKELLYAVDVAEERINERKILERNRLLLEKYESILLGKETIGIPTIEGFEIIQLDNILRCEGMQNCTRIITRDRSDIISSYNLGKFIKLLGEDNFFSPHKSHLVNFRYVKKFLREGTIIMDDGSHVPVSKRRKTDFLKYFKHF